MCYLNNTVYINSWSFIPPIYLRLLQVNPSHVRHHKILRDSRNEMETAIVGIHFVVTDQHFENGKLKVRFESLEESLASDSLNKTRSFL